LVSIDRRVSSPRAANTEARAVSVLIRHASTRLSRLFDMSSDVFDLFAPTSVIHPERLEASLARDLVEASLDDRNRVPVAISCNVNSTSVDGSSE
jgi:hypothetical protein